MSKSEDTRNQNRADEDVGGPRGWYSRGYVPHCDGYGLLQSITFRLADSLPKQTLIQMQRELSRIPKERQNPEKRRRIEFWLDQGLGCCALRHPTVAEKVQESLLHFHGVRYQLVAWCIMPNHVHVLANCRDQLAKIVQGWKSFTSRWVLARNEELGLSIPDKKQFWMREYWDRYIRDEEHLLAVTAYIHNNPVKAGLCEQMSDWRWSSANPDSQRIICADGDVGGPGADA